jgi:hypothetical protein
LRCPTCLPLPLRAVVVANGSGAAVQCLPRPAWAVPRA